jgi:hypothetical protein
VPDLPQHGDQPACPIWATADGPDAAGAQLARVTGRRFAGVRPAAGQERQLGAAHHQRAVGLATPLAALARNFVQATDRDRQADY